MHFILVDGVSWMFCSLLKEGSGVYTTFQSEIFLLSKLGDIVEISKLLVLMNEWVCFWLYSTDLKFNEIYSLAFTF